MRKSNFWPMLLIIIGTVYILKHVFFFTIKLSGIIFAFIFIYWGISLLKGKKGSNDSREDRGRREDREDFIFSNSEVKATNNQDKYDMIFSNGTIDLTTLPVPVDRRDIKIDTIFSRSLIKINPEIPAIIKVSSVFSSAHLPNNTHISFGEYTYATRSFRDGGPHLNIKIDVVFGNTDVIEQ